MTAGAGGRIQHSDLVGGYRGHCWKSKDVPNRHLPWKAGISGSPDVVFKIPTAFHFGIRCRRYHYVIYHEFHGGQVRAVGRVAAKRP